MNSTANSSLPAKNGPTIGYTGIAMAGTAAAGTAMATSNRNEDDQSFDGSFISDKPSEADIRLVASKSALLSPEQIDGLNRRIDTALNTGEWANVLTEANAITEHAEEASTKESTNASDEASQRTTKSQSFLGRLFGGGANDDTKGHVSTGSGALAVAAGTATAAVAVASSSSDKTPETPQKSTDDNDATAQDEIVLAPTKSSEGSPNVSSPPDESSSGSAFTNFGSDSAVASLGSSLFVDPNVSVSETNNSQVSADCPLITDKEDTKRKKSPKNLFGLGSKKSSSTNVPTSGDYDDLSSKTSWKQKLGFGGKSKSASDAIDNNLAMLEDSSVESRSLGSDAMNEDDIASSMSSVAAAPRSANAGSFAAAALPPDVTSGNSLNDVSSDIYASSASASVPTDHDADDAMSHRSFVDDLDVAIETGNWAAVEAAAANMLDGISSSDASYRMDDGISSAASSDFHSAGSHISSSRCASPIGASTVNSAKVKDLERAIEKNDWQRVLELSGKYKKEASEDGESPKGAAAAAAWAIDRSFQDQIGEGEENVSGRDEV